MTDSRPIHCVVLVKQVPDTHNLSGEVMTKDGTMNRGALPAIFNPEDLNALEMALQIKERTGGTVTVMTMGPPSAASVLRDSLYRGADRVVLLTDRKFAGADTLATSYVLKCAVEKLGAVRPGPRAAARPSTATPPRSVRRRPRSSASRRSPTPSRSSTSTPPTSPPPRALDSGSEIVRCKMPGPPDRRRHGQHAAAAVGPHARWSTSWPRSRTSTPTSLTAGPSSRRTRPSTRT